MKKTLGKFYSVDLGFLHIMFDRDKQFNQGHQLENIVYLELLRRHSQVYIGKADNAEVDFVIKNKTGETEYIQVAWTAKDESTVVAEYQAEYRRSGNYQNEAELEKEFIRTLQSQSYEYLKIKSEAANSFFSSSVLEAI